MSVLLEKQWKFTRMVADLVLYAYDTLGWTLTYGDTFRDSRCNYGAPNSLHRMRLAVDFNLFVDGKWIDGQGTASEVEEEYMYWERLGIYWEKLGGSWGGRFKSGPNAKDLNHFSLEHNGMR